MSVLARSARKREVSHSMIYLDHNATTPCYPQAFDAMRDAALTHFANPASVHDAGTQAAYLLESARATIASLLNAQHDEVIFTSGGTESNALALAGRIEHLQTQHKSLRVLCPISEHHAVLHTLEALARKGAITLIPWVPDSDGLLHLDEALLDQHAPHLVTCMLANNETGTVQRIADLAQLCNARKIDFHCDGVQGPGKLPVDFKALGADSMALAAHKFGGPKGVGILLKKQGYALTPQLHGGAQESGLRPGTHNVPGAVGAATALEISIGKLNEEAQRIVQLRDTLWNALEHALPNLKVNGLGAAGIVGNTLNVSLPGASGADMVRALSDRGVCASAGSACTATNELRASHVLKAMGLDDTHAAGALRFSLGWTTTQAEIEHAIPLIVEVLKHAT